MGKTAQRKRSFFELGVNDGRKYGPSMHYIRGRKDMVNAYAYGVKAGLSELTPTYSPDYADGADYGAIAFESEINEGLWTGLKRVALLAALVLVILLLTGCPTISISTPEGCQASYTRIGSQDISGLTYSRDGNSTLIGMDKQHTDSRIIDAVRLLLGAQ